MEFPKSVRLLAVTLFDQSQINVVDVSVERGKKFIFFLQTYQPILIQRLSNLFIRLVLVYLPLLLVSIVYLSIII